MNQKDDVTPIPCNLPFERVPEHGADPGFGPVPPKPDRKVVPLRDVPEELKVDE
jgi:hypothetical protein